MMAGEYTAPIVISLLLALAKLRDAYPRLRAGAAGKALGAGAAGDSLRLLASGWGEVGLSLGQWRTVSRLVGAYIIKCYSRLGYEREMSGKG